MLRQQLLQVSGEQLLLHGEADPGSGLTHVRLDLTDVLNVSADKTIDREVRRDFEIIPENKSKDERPFFPHFHHVKAGLT